MVVETKYGKVDMLSLKLYNEDLRNRTFSLLYLYEQQPFETYQIRVNDLLQGAIEFRKIDLQMHGKFLRYIENLQVILNPQPMGCESEHDFVKRHILNAVNILSRIIDDIKKAVEDGKQEQIS